MNIAHKAFHALFSPPRSTAQSEAEDRNPNSTKPSAPTPAKPTSEHRCEYTFSDGRQCRNQRAQLCVHHVSRQCRPAKNAPDDALEAPELETLCADLTTATSINRALAQTFLLMAQGRISRKDAVAFGYLGQLLLQTVPGVRAEYVSAFGYHDWEENLTARLRSSGSAAKGYQQDALSPRNKVKLKSSLEQNPSDKGPANDDDGATSTVILGESNSSGERRISPNPPPERESPPTSPPISNTTTGDKQPGNGVVERPLHERVTSPDYDSLLSRSRDMLAGKYDATPEGRREAKTLNLELELMNPPASKWPKGVRASVIEHMKRWIAQRKAPIRPGSASPAHSESEGPLFPPAFPPVDFYGNPIKLAVPWDEVKRDAQTASPLPARVHPQVRSSDSGGLHRTPGTGDALFADNKVELSPANKVSRETAPTSQSPAASPSTPPKEHPRQGDFVAPPARRPAVRPLHHSAPTHIVNAEPASPYAGLDGFPGPGPAAVPPDSDLPNQPGHQKDWFAPASWSNTRSPDPFPSRKEKLARKLRGMTNYGFRRLQHLNSRGL